MADDMDRMLEPVGLITSIERAFLRCMGVAEVVARLEEFSGVPEVRTLLLARLEELAQEDAADVRLVRDAVSRLLALDETALATRKRPA